MKSLISFVVLFWVVLVNAVSSSGDRLLVVLEDVAEKEGYSKFLGDLEGRGFQINYETPKSDSLRLFNLGEKSYDHVLFLPTKSKGLGPHLTPKILLDFINADGNILLALSASQPAPTSLVSLLLELDIHLPPDRQGLVVDHFNYDVLSAPEKHDVLLLPTPGALRPDVRDFFSPSSSSEGVIAFPSGTGQTLGSGALLTPILRAPSTSYSYNPKEQAETIDDLFASGNQLSLVSTMQARNSARFTVVGSAELLSDKWFDAKVKKVGETKEVATVNREFAKSVSGWTFQEIGVLRVNSVTHHLNEVGQSNASNPKIYRIKNDVTYSISLSEYVWDKYVPFTVPESDELQLEFSMLSPFHRLNLAPTTDDADNGKVYTASFKLPDQHGIFNFKVNYKRPFLTNVEEKATVSVRHFAHDEWPRSYVISGAWPWLAGISATVTGWLGFCAIWLYSKPATEAEESKKTQ
ncbi:Dolichyl-diphosphooligosaccharide-protein glycosyltransferase 48kDa subunit [Annulohypoxylon moriforme]|nr:Dolichyl-diphosphooligosaccharide-protein glycosyltransferase 48kDa subunit [Annulohypoxylon moriforme]